MNNIKKARKKEDGKKLKQEEMYWCMYHWKRTQIPCPQDLTTRKWTSYVV